jgi:NAD+ kinase
VQRIGILTHPLRPGAGPVREQLDALLQTRGISTWQRSTSDDNSTLVPLIADSDLVIAIGGDGTMLRAARTCAPAHVPVFGINTGRLGFLTETSGADDSWRAAIETLLDGHYWIEQRMMITAEVWRNGTMIVRADALNDVVVSRSMVARSVYLDLYIDGGWTAEYHVDGLIIATPTGSTAYALAVGGPILPPELKNLLIAPVAPHLSMDRSIVLAEGATVEIVLAPDTLIDVVMTVDGESDAALQPADRVIVRASEQHSHFVRLRERNYFYRSLLDRMEPRIRARQMPTDQTVPKIGTAPTTAVVKEL